MVEHDGQRCAEAKQIEPGSVVLPLGNPRPDGVRAVAFVILKPGAALDEAAVIAGLFQSPERQSPFVDMRRAVQRRNVVLQRMADEGYISQPVADEARSRPITLFGQPQPDRSIAPYFLEEVRKHLERQYGAKALYESGLSVTTTLDPKLQAKARAAMHKVLKTPGDPDAAIVSISNFGDSPMPSAVVRYRLASLSA